MKILNRVVTSSAACSLLVLCAAASAQSGPQDRVSRSTAADGTQVTVVSGQPITPSYGPKPAFAQLDTNHDGFIDRNEAEAFVPLSNDFDHLAYHTTRISQRAYAGWDYR